MAVELDEEGLRIDGEPFALLSGSVQYWRLDPRCWGAVLDSAAVLGFRCIETYAPWSVHEREDGSFDFEGPRDLGRFLDLAAERELKVILRPGPHINAELTGFGFPARVLADPECQARSAAGNPVWVPAPPRMFPAPSYAGDKLYQAFERYLVALAAHVRPRVHPAGPVILLQADNELCFFFRSGAFEQDYGPASIAEYRRFARKRYRRIDALREAYGDRSLDFDTLVPPSRFDARQLRDLPPYLDWQEFRELTLRVAIRRVASLFERHGLDLPVIHNLPMGSLRSPLDLAGLENDVAAVGLDLYYSRADYVPIKTRCLELCGASRFPFAAELGFGGHLAWPPVDLQDQTFATLVALMHGLRGFNFYMLVDRDRWYGAPIRRDGSLDPERADFVRRVLRLVRELGSARRRPDVGLATSRLYGRIESLSCVHAPLSPMALSALGLHASAWCGQERDRFGLGCKRIPAASLARTGRALFEALGLARLDFNLFELGDRKLEELRLLILPTVEFLSRRDAERLLDYMRRGGTLVVGPDLPDRDERGRKLGLLTRARSEPAICGQGRLVLWPDLDKRTPKQLESDLREAGRRAGCRLLPDPADESLETALHVEKHTGRLFVWIANPTAQERQAEISVPLGRRFLDIWRVRATERGDDGHLATSLPPYSVRVFEVLP
ncbi:MAG: beta-galactosidase [Deltaproteobacteria bacterium]|nr:beta-galactosidase [Deltaproteobacteria bacterium]